MPAERELVERFWERIRLFARRRLNVPSAAEDVAQETMRRVLAALRDGRVHTTEALPAFVFQTARNVCLHRHRSTTRRRRALNRLRHRVPGPEVVPDPLVDLVTRRRRQRVRQALERLDARDREILRLSYYDGVTTAEVASRLDITPGAARVRRHRALKRLRTLLVEPDDSESGGASTHGGPAPPGESPSARREEER